MISEFDEPDQSQTSPFRDVRRSRRRAAAGALGQAEDYTEQPYTPGADPALPVGARTASAPATPTPAPAPTSPALASATGVPYQGPWGGFDQNRMAGGAADSTAGNAKYYFTQVAQNYDPYQVHNDRATAERLLADLNQNPNGWTYSLTAGNDFLNNQDNDGAYMGGRPIGGWSANAEDPSNAANWQYQWLPPEGSGGGRPATTGPASLAALQASLVPPGMGTPSTTYDDLLAQIMQSLAASGVLNTNPFAGGS